MLITQHSSNLFQIVILLTCEALFSKREQVFIKGLYLYGLNTSEGQAHNKSGKTKTIVLIEMGLKDTCKYKKLGFRERDKDGFVELPFKICSFTVH